MSKDMLVKVEAQYPISGGAPILVSGGGGRGGARGKRERLGRAIGGAVGGLGAIAGKHRSLGSLLQSIVSGYAQGKDLGGGFGRVFVSPERQAVIDYKHAKRMAEAKANAANAPTMARRIGRGVGRANRLAEVAVEGARRAGEGLSHGMDYLEGTTPEQLAQSRFEDAARASAGRMQGRVDEQNQKEQDLKDALRGVDDLLYESRGAPKVGVRGATPVRLPDYTRQLGDIDPSALNIYAPALASGNIDRGVDTTNVLVDSERAAALNANKQTMANAGAGAATVPATPMTVLPPANGEGTENAADVQMGHQVIAQTGLDDDPDLAGTNPADGVTPVPTVSNEYSNPAIRDKVLETRDKMGIAMNAFEQVQAAKRARMAQGMDENPVTAAYETGQLALSEDRLPVVGIRKARRGILVV